jgi:thioredoxin 1
MSQNYQPETQTRQEIDSMRGAAVLDFGTNWCGYCNAARPLVDAAFERRAGVSHLRIEDGKGRRLGRSFQVKLWPTLIFMRDGREIARVVRPNEPSELDEAFDQLETH